MNRFAVYTMEPSDLPTELFTMVIDHANGGVSELGVLCNWSLVSRQWHASLLPRIYSKWMWDGDWDSISYLWKFLRTIVSSRRIADTVHTLRLENWTSGRRVRRRHRFAIPEEDIHLIRNAIRIAGIQHIETSFFEALRNADPRPLVALLLANLRNLTALHAPIHETDPFLVEVLQKAAESGRSEPPNDYGLKSLRKAYFGSSRNYPHDRSRVVNIHYMRPIFHLPNIQQLSLNDFDPLGASDLLGDSPRTSSITDLRLHHWSIHGLLLETSDMLTVLAWPKALTKLVIMLEDYAVPVRGQISNTDLWTGIRQCEDSLEYLDIYRDWTSCTHASQHSYHHSHFGSMQGFKRLEHLSIQPEILLGGCCQSDEAPQHLKDTLPPSLKSLTLYGTKGVSLNKMLGQQLDGVETKCAL